MNARTETDLVEQTNAVRIADRLPMLVEALRDGGVADPAADLVQVLAGLILLRESEARDPQRLAHAGRNSGSVLQDPSNRLNLLRDEWRTIPNLLGTALFQTLEVPEMIARGGRNAARVLEFLGEEVEKHSLGELGGPVGDFYVLWT